MTIPQPEPRGYPGNLGLLFAEHAQSDRPAIIDLRDPKRLRPVSFRELDAGCNALARGLAKAGLKLGDRMGILSLNRVEFVMTLLGAMRAGVVPVPVNIKLPADAVAYILNDAGARLVFAESGTKQLVPDGLRVVDYDSDFERFLDPGSFKAFEPVPDTIAIQPYTSGSTGRPKGVLLTHYGQNWSRRVLAHTRGTTERDVILIAAPLYHKNALNAIKQGLTAGAMLPLLPQFDIERYIEAIGHHHCTVISGVPTMMAMVLTRKDRLAKTDTSSVRTIMMGSAPSSSQLLKELKACFPNAEPLVVYGVTEGGPVPLGPHPEGKPRPPGSLGVPYPGTEAKLVGGPYPDEGELVLKNPGVLLSYHNLPEETAKQLRDGWYYTGDVCRRDRDGFYYFVGRTDDMFVSGGENIFPGEVEALLARHPAVHQALVLPFDHELKGQVPFAFVVLRDGAKLTEEELKQFALANGPAYQHPRRVFFLEQFPLAGTNKVDRERLRQWVAEGAPARVMSDGSASRGGAGSRLRDATKVGTPKRGAGARLRVRPLRRARQPTLSAPILATSDSEAARRAADARKAELTMACQRPLSSDGGESMSQQPVAVEKLQELISRGPFNRWLNFTVLTSGEDGVEIKAAWREEWVVNPERRYTHGGILAAILDVAADYAIAAQLGRPVPTVDIRVDYHKAALPGDLVAKARVVRMGSQYSTAEAYLYDKDGALVASGRGTYFTAPPK